MAIRSDVLAILAAGVLWGTLSPAGKHLGQLGTDMLTVAFLRAVIMTLGVGAFLAFYKPASFRITLRQAIQIAAISGVSIVGIYAGFFFSLKYLSIPLTIVIYFTHPVITAAGSLLITKEKPTRLQTAAAILTLIGVMVAILPSNGSAFESLHPVGFAWCLFSAVGMAFYSLFGRLSAQTGFVSQTSLFFYAQAFGVLWLAMYKAIFSGWGDIAFLSSAQLFWILYVGLFASMFSYSMYFFGLRSIQASTASIVSSIEIVTAFSLSAIALGQPPEPREVTGALLIIFAIILVTRRNSRLKTGDLPGFRGPR